MFPDEASWLRGFSMLRIVIATSRPQGLQAFAEALASEPEVQIGWVASGAEALEDTRLSGSHLIIIDSALPDISPMELVQKLLMVNAMVNTAMVSSLSEAEFHEASEGLGVLSRLPDTPRESDAVELLHRLKKVLGGTG
jgi:DNA-binding NarL/FixJ family response regulator